MSIICLLETVRNVVLKTFQFVSVFILPRLFVKFYPFCSAFAKSLLEGEVFPILTISLLLSFYKGKLLFYCHHY